MDKDTKLLEEAYNSLGASTTHKDGDKGVLIDDMYYGGENEADEFMNRGVVSGTWLREHIDKIASKGDIVQWSNAHNGYINDDEMNFDEEFVKPI